MASNACVVEDGDFDKCGCFHFWWISFTGNGTSSYHDGECIADDEADAGEKMDSRDCDEVEGSRDESEECTQGMKDGIDRSDIGYMLLRSDTNVIEAV